jgi:uncharacterized protein
MSRAANIAGLIAPLTALVMLVCGAATAAEIDDLYQGQTIVTGEREETRAPGIAECLEDVLVKVSGDPRLIGDPRVAEMAKQAGTMVSDFRYHDRMSGIPHHDEQGTRDRPYDLIVGFEPAKIDGALRSLGRVPWSASRPRVVVFLGMRNMVASYMLADDGDRALEHEAIAAAAARRGVPLILPSQAALDQAGLRFETLPTTDLSHLDAAAQAIGGDLALVGRMAWSDAAMSWVADWRLNSAGSTYQWQVRSVTFDDGFRKALGGAAQILSGNGQPS